MLWNNCNVGRGIGGPQELIITWQCKVTIQDYLHFIFKLNQKRIFAQDICISFHNVILDLSSQGGRGPLFYDFAIMRWNPLPPIMRLFPRLNTVFHMKRILCLFPIKKHCQIFLEVVPIGHFQTAPTADCQKTITKSFKMLAMNIKQSKPYE